MKKKFILLTVIITYLTFVLSSPVGLAISSDISFDIEDKEIEEPIKFSESKVISFKVKYRLDVGFLGKCFYLNRRIGRVLAFGFFKLYFFKFLNPLPNALLNLSVDINDQDWLQAELDKYEVELKYDNVYQEADVKLTFSLKENAPALKKSEIIIIADFLGTEGSIDATSNSTNISFMPAYISNISIQADTNFTISPLKEAMISINISNSGNGESRVRLTGFEKENWSITPNLENITLGIQESQQMMIGIIPPKKFDNETITFTFEPFSTVESVNSSYRQGKSVDFSITFYNDGSSKEDENIDITIIIIIALVVIIILIIVFLIFRKK